MRVFTKQRRAFVVRVRTFPEAGRLATVLPRSEYRSDALIAFLDELQDIIRRDAFGRDFGKGRALLGAAGRDAAKLN